MHKSTFLFDKIVKFFSIFVLTGASFLIPSQRARENPELLLKLYILQILGARTILTNRTKRINNFK